MASLCSFLVPFLFKKLFIYLSSRAKKRKSVKAGERESFQSLIHFLKWLPQPDPSQAKATKNSVLTSYVSVWMWITWAIIYCLSRCISRKLGWEQRVWYSKQHSMMRCQHQKWLNLVDHNTSHWSVSAVLNQVCFHHVHGTRDPWALARDLWGPTDLIFFFMTALTFAMKVQKQLVTPLTNPGSTPTALVDFFILGLWDRKQKVSLKMALMKQQYDKYY